MLCSIVIEQDFWAQGVGVVSSACVLCYSVGLGAQMPPFGRRMGCEGISSSQSFFSKLVVTPQAAELPGHGGGEGEVGAGLVLASLGVSLPARPSARRDPPSAPSVRC